MDKFTRAFVAVAVIAVTTLGTFGTAYAKDTAATTAGKSCSYEGYTFPNGAKLTTGTGKVMYCLDGDWVSTGTSSGGKPIAAPSVLGSLVSIFKR